MKTISEYSKTKTGLDVQSLKALDAISEWMEYKGWTAEDGTIYLQDVKAKKDIPLSAKRTIKEGTEFGKVGLTQQKQILLYRENEDKPYRRIMKHPISEDAFPAVPVMGTYPAHPVIWNDGRIDGPFEPMGDVNGVMRDALVIIGALRRKIEGLTVDQASILAKGLGNTFEEVVLREVFRAMFKEQASPFYFGLR